MDFHRKWTFQDETKKTWKAELPTLKNKKMRAFSNLGKTHFFFFFQDFPTKPRDIMLPHDQNQWAPDFFRFQKKMSVSNLSISGVFLFSIKIPSKSEHITLKNKKVRAKRSRLSKITCIFEKFDFWWSDFRLELISQEGGAPSGGDLPGSDHRRWVRHPPEMEHKKTRKWMN